MIRPFCPSAEVDWFSGRLTVGVLMALCEDNFVLLSRLAPHIRGQRGPFVSRRRGGVDLYLEIEEQSRYTTVVRMTHYFPRPRPATGPLSTDADRAVGLGPDPDLRLRVYHDARQVEVLDLRQTALPTRTYYEHPALEAKWRVNLFLAKWLRYCLSEGHGFGPRLGEITLPEDDDLLSTCS